MQKHDGYRSRKFVLTCICLAITAPVFLFTDKMDGPTWVAFCTLVLGVSFAANVAEKRP